MVQAFASFLFFYVFILAAIALTYYIGITVFRFLREKEKRTNKTEDNHQSNTSN